MPFGAKDIFDSAGLTTSAGFRPYANRVPQADSEPIARLKRAGAILLGKMVTTQFAYADPSKTRNPWADERTPGCSSSGSAAGVAAHLIPLALGSQTAGSVLRPAAYNGVVGFKPTYGRISKRGVFPLAWSLGWGTWMLCALLQISFYAVLARHLSEHADLARLAVTLACAGMAIDLSCDTIFLAVLPHFAAGGPENVPVFLALEKLTESVSLVVANSLYVFACFLLTLALPLPVSPAGRCGRRGGAWDPES